MDSISLSISVFRVVTNSPQPPSLSLPLGKKLPVSQPQNVLLFLKTSNRRFVTYTWIVLTWHLNFLPILLCKTIHIKWCLNCLINFFERYYLIYWVFIGLPYSSTGFLQKTILNYTFVFKTDVKSCVRLLFFTFFNNTSRSSSSPRRSHGSHTCPPSTCQCWLWRD